MSERNTVSNLTRLILIGVAVLCLVNVACFIYFVANFAAVWTAPLPKDGAILFWLSLALLVALVFRRAVFRNMTLGPVLLGLSVLSYFVWAGAFEQRRDYASIRLAVSEICDVDRPKTDQTEQYCRRFVVKPSGYLCNVGETPMARCESALRKVAGRPDNLERSLATEAEPDQP